MENKNYTIKDIARMAGVSAGTVDRVLHNRGDVSAASREKVQKVLDEIDYHPNMFARPGSQEALPCSVYYTLLYGT